MKIRKATISDANAIHRLHTNSVRTACKNHYTQEQLEAWLKGRSPDGYYNDVNKGNIFVAEEGGKIVGFGQAITGEVVAAYVDPVFHGKGFGKLIFEHGLEIASKDSKIVKVESTLNAESFYKKFGFIKIKESFVIRNGTEIPVIIMER